MQLNMFNGNANLLDQTTNKIEMNKKSNIESTFVQDNEENIFSNTPKNQNEFGVWIYTNYDEKIDEKKLDIDLINFLLMLRSGSWKYYTLTMENTDDTTVGLQFVKTKIYLENEGIFVDVVQTKFNFETMCDTTEDFDVALEIRFPFSLLNSKAKSYNNYFNNNDHNVKRNKIINRIGKIFENSQYHFLNTLYEKFINFFQHIINTHQEQSTFTSESYFSVRIGYSSPENDEGPKKVDTRFFFGRNSIWEPRVFRMKITPYDIEKNYKLTYNNIYLTVDQYGNEAFYRIFSIDFQPAVELQITSIPGKGKISYNFGNSNNDATKISFSAIGGLLSEIIQSFTIDPLPSEMSFNLTVMGEKSFLYESDTIHSVTYMMDSFDEEGNLVKLELENLPKKITAEWGLNVFLLSLSSSGFVDLDMSGDVGRMTLSLYDSEMPFIELNNFPKKLRIDGYIDVPQLQGSITASKYSGITTTINVPLNFNKWRIIGTININNGYGSASFNLPDSSSNYISVGLDTNNNALFGLSFSVVDTESDTEVLYIGVEAIATDNFFISFDSEGGLIGDLDWSGKITELIDLIISVDYQGAALDISTSWTLGETGSFEIALDKDVNVNFGDIETDQFKLDGSISLNEGRYVKFEWEWGSIGYFMVFTNGPIGNELYLEIGFGSVQSGEYQYGFKIEASDFLDLTRKVLWDTENGIVPRIWFLGDNGFPGNWDVWLLWNYEWYEVK
jgi:hypothetical protein